MNTEYTFTTHKIGTQSATSQRYEAACLIVRYQDASFGGVARDIIELVDIVLDAESREQAHNIVTLFLEERIPALNSPGYGLEYFYRLQRIG